jgi:tetratricopeptide (TPR) repeat protein
LQARFYSWLLFAVLSGLAPGAQALEILHLYEASEYARVLRHANGIKITDGGTVYVSSEENGTLLKLDDDRFEAFSLSPSIFEDPGLGGIDMLADGRLVVVNEESSKLAILGAGQNLETRFSRSGRGPGELGYPRAVAVSANNNIYVGDVRGRQISVFNHQGLYLQSFGRNGPGGDGLSQPTHIAIDAEENVYVLEAPSRISIFDHGGLLIDRITAEELRPLFGNVPEFSAMTADSSGTLYLGDRVNSRIAVFDWRKRELLAQFGRLGPSRGQYLTISQLSVNDGGQIAILDNRNEKVEVLQLEAIEIAAPVARDRFEFVSASEAACESLAFYGENSALCIRSDEEGISILADDGAELGRFASEVKEPHALYVGRQSVAILEGSQLHGYSLEGDRLFTTGRFGIGAGAFDRPVDVFIHGGFYYVSDRGNRRIQVFSADGQFVEQIKGQQNGERLFSEPGAIVVDSHGNLYVADDDGSEAIRVIDKQHKLIASIGAGQEPAGRIEHIYSMDIDLQDRLYVLAGSDFNEYGVRVYSDLKPYRYFGAEGNNDTLAFFEEATSISVSSGTTNSLVVNDSARRKQFRFRLLEYPDPAFGLNIAADRKAIELSWSSSQSPLIARYDIEAAKRQDGPFRTIATSTETRLTLGLEKAGKFDWFRVVSVSALDLHAPPSVAKQNQFRTIDSLYRSGDYSEAATLAEKLLRIAPYNADARDLLAMSLFHLKEYTRAIGEFERLAEFDPYRDKAIRYRIRSLVELEQFIEARALVEDQLERKSADIETYLVCTRLDLELGDYIGAVNCAEDGLDEYPEHAELRYLLGRSYIAAGIPGDGLNAYRAVSENHPDEIDIRLDIARDLYVMGRYEDALGHYEAVAEARPDMGEASVGKARALLNLGRDDEAKSIASKLSGNRETRADGYYLLGKIASRQENYKEAILRLTRAVKDDPGVADAWYSLASAFEAIDQQANAAQALAEGVEHNPEAFDLYLLAGRIELERERYTDASTYLDAAVGLNPQSLQAQRLYAGALLETRNYRSAAIHAEAASKIAPQNVDVLVLQADIANRQGKIGSAIEYLKNAINIDAASPELQYRIGQVYQEANLFDASRDHLERAAAIRPDWAAPHVALGYLYGKRRRFDDAVAAFEKAVELEPSDENRAILNVAFAERKKSLEFKNNAPQLLLSDLNLQRVFSAAYKQYQTKPIGSVKVKNVGATDFGNLKLSFQIKEFMDFPSSVEIAKIAANEVLEIPIKATFNNRILEVDEDTGVQVEVRLGYQRDGQKDDISLTQAMTIYGKNAIVWADPKMIGSFVTPKDDTLRNYVRQVINTYQPEPGPLNDNLVAAMAYFSSLTASGTNYIIDPNTPFTELRDDQIDYVQFPRETLRLKSGDCDDLSVLISAGLENLGIKTAFIEVPRHLFLMFDTGLKAEDADSISHDHSLLAIKDGNVWIPLEATMINTNFNEAWAEGARKYQAALAAGELGIIDLRQAWSDYQPVTLRKANYSIDLPQPRRTESLVRQARQRLLAKRVERLILPYQAMVANNPQDLDARLQIAILYTRYGLYADAEIAFEALNELAPDNSAVITNQGNLYLLQENYAGAAENYARAVELDADDGGIWINLSIAQYKAGELTKARNSFKNALQLNAELQQKYDAYSKLLNQ